MKIQRFEAILLKELEIALQDTRIRNTQKLKQKKLSTFSVHAMQRAKERFPNYKTWDLYKDFSRFLYARSYAIPNGKYVVIGEIADYVVSAGGRILTVDEFKYSKVDLSKEEKRKLEKAHKRLLND